MYIFKLTYFFEINLEKIAKIIITWKIIMNGFRFGYSHYNRNVHDSRLSLRTKSHTPNHHKTPQTTPNRYKTQIAAKAPQNTLDQPPRIDI